MITEADMLFIYLETQQVHHQGKINENELNQFDRQTIELWHQEKLMEVTPLPQPERTKKNEAIQPLYTHHVKFTDQAWDIAAALRKNKALIPNAPGDEAPPKNPQPKAEQHDVFNTEEFNNFLTVHGHKLSYPQQAIINDIFPILNKKEYSFFWAGKKTGKTWLLKTIDQYLTSLHNKKGSS